MFCSSKSSTSLEASSLSHNIRHNQHEAKYNERKKILLQILLQCYFEAILPPALGCGRGEPEDLSLNPTEGRWQFSIISEGCKIIHMLPGSSVKQAATRFKRSPGEHNGPSKSIWIKSAWITADWGRPRGPLKEPVPIPALWETSKKKKKSRCILLLTPICEQSIQDTMKF